MPLVENKLLNGYHISKVAELQLRIFNVQVAHRHIGVTETWKKHVKSSMRTDSTQLMTFVTCCNYYMVHANAF